jgi:hypothetical protein
VKKPGAALPVTHDPRAQALHRHDKRRPHRREHPQGSECTLARVSDSPAPSRCSDGPSRCRASRVRRRC